MPRDYNLYREGVQDYVLELMPQKHGFPLRDPGVPDFYRASEGFQEYRGTAGPQVGDVGHLGTGSFMCFFNIFLPKDHPLNSKCPASFIPCSSSSSTRTIEQYFPPDTEINTMRSVPFGSKPDGTTAIYDAGAILKLPNGAKRVDAVDIEHIRKYAIENAPLWIKEDYVNFEDLYLVTGTDLTNNWNIFLQFAPRRLFERRQTPKGRVYYEELTVVESPRRWDSTKKSDASLEHHNQCVFLRGFRIGYRYKKQSLPRRLLRRTKELVPGGPFIPLSRPEGKQPLPGTMKRFFYDLRGRLAKLGVVYEISYPPHFHPLSVINEMLLFQNPFAFVAVTHDNDWISILHEDDTVTPGPLTLIKRIQRNFEQVRYKDGVYLKPRPHHKLHITTSGALTASQASTEESESDGEAEPITGDISPFLLASIAVSADVNSGLKNVAQAALNLMQATVRVEVYTREWTFLAGRFISAIASMTCLLADESRTKDGVWDKVLGDIESLLDRAVSSVQNQAGSVPRSRLLSGATSLRDIIYFNIRLGRVLAPLKLSKLADAPTSKIRTQADIDRTIDVVAKKLQP